MAELDTLHALERETGLLASRGDVEHMRRTSYQFTKLAASRLRREGWRLLKAPPGGNNIDGVRIDKLINATDLRIVDIIVNADEPDGPQRQPAWQFEGHFGKPSDVVVAPAEIEPEPPPPPPATPPPSEADLELKELVDTLERIYGGMVEMLAVMADLSTRAAELQKNGIKLRLR